MRVWVGECVRSCIPDKSARRQRIGAAMIQLQLCAPTAVGCWWRIARMSNPFARPAVLPVVTRTHTRTHAHLHYLHRLRVYNARVRARPVPVQRIDGQRAGGRAGERAAIEPRIAFAFAYAMRASVRRVYAHY